MLSNEGSDNVRILDLFHYGHMKLLGRGKNQGDFLIVGLFTD